MNPVRKFKTLNPYFVSTKFNLNPPCFYFSIVLYMVNSKSKNECIEIPLAYGPCIVRELLYSIKQ